MSASFEKSHVVLLSANDPRIEDSDTIMSLEELYLNIRHRLLEDLHIEANIEYEKPKLILKLKGK